VWAPDVLARSSDELARLRAIDSPTLSNAIERFKVRPRSTGYAGYELRCAFPELGSMIGYAVTCTGDSTTEDRQDADGLLRLWDAVERAPKPAVIVIQDIGNNPARGCHMGEVMATTARALGAVGCVCDSGLRDVAEVRALGFHYFCPGFVVSHGNAVIVDVGVPVEVFGLQMSPGDLLHGDVNGLLSVPDIPTADLVAQVQQVRDEEHRLMDYIRAPGFSAGALRRRKYGH
jgi:4-hydroxy-4-methyl-2-oxoglutarate aldolase